MDIKVEGLKELEQALLELNKEYGPKSAGSAVRPAIRKAITPAVAALESATPRDTGKLAESIKLRIRKPTKKMIKGAGGHHKESHILTATLGYEWRKPSLWNRALATEFGNSDTPQQAPLRRTLNSHSGSILETFSRELAESIEKTATRLAKKRSK